MAKIGNRKVAWGGVSPQTTSGAASVLDEVTLSGESLADEVRRRRRGPSRRLVSTPEGPLRLTPTELLIMQFIERHAARPVSKAQIAAALGRNEKTVDRLLSRMRKNGVVVSEPVFAANGAHRVRRGRVARVLRSAPR